MSVVLGELERVRGAYRQPTLTLLHQRQAPVVISLFRTCFAQERRTVPASLLHSQIESSLDTLRQLGHADVRSGTGREVCRTWVTDQPLVRADHDTGAGTYVLTSHTQDTLTSGRRTPALRTQLERSCW